MGIRSMFNGHFPINLSFSLSVVYNSYGQIEIRNKSNG